MRINANMSALNTHRQLSANQASTGRSVERLSSGLRINRAGDDAAGLAISEKMRGQIRGLSQASRNAQDGISMIQTAEGALNETHAILQRMRELAVQSATDTNTTDDRHKIQSEVDELAREITRISNTTEFNTQNLLAGGLNNRFHIGSNANQFMDLSVVAMDAQSLGVAGSVSVLSGAFGARNSGITSVTNIGRNLAERHDYNIDVVRRAATGSAITASPSTPAPPALAAAPADLVVTGFNRTSDTAYLLRVAGVNATPGDNHVTSLEFSRDGGATWGTAGVGGTAANIVFTFDGITLNTSDGAGISHAVGNTYSFTATVASATLQLQAGETNIGSAVTVRAGMTSAELGNEVTGQTLTANFNFNDLFVATTGPFGTDNFIISQGQSSAAVTSGGVVSTEAVARAGILVNTQVTANNAITVIDNALTSVSTERSKLGAIQNRLDHTIANLGTSAENLTAAESRIRDVDMAEEMMEFTKNNILSQAAQAMLAQANQLPQGVLQLLR
ncbi:MAG: flagellin [Firmicutes bacterium]|nr:flagellin [Dethiobacter sp.]MBS3888629.1 flagellin [Bacillota bacterium]